MLNKIGVIGGGNIGGVLIQELVKRRLARNVALVDVKDPELAKGKTLDIAEGTPVIGSDVEVEGSKTYLDKARRYFFARNNGIRTPYVLYDAPVRFGSTVIPNLYGN